MLAMDNVSFCRDSGSGITFRLGHITSENAGKFPKRRADEDIYILLEIGDLTVGHLTVNKSILRAIHFGLDQNIRLKRHNGFFHGLGPGGGFSVKNQGENSCVVMIEGDSGTFYRHVNVEFINELGRVLSQFASSAKLNE